MVWWPTGFLSLRKRLPPCHRGREACVVVPSFGSHALLSAARGGTAADATAVQRDDRAREVLPGGGGKENAQSGDVVRTAQPPQWNGAPDPVKGDRVIHDELHHPALERSGGDCVHRDRLSGKFFGEMS